MKELEVATNLRNELELTTRDAEDRYCEKLRDTIMCGSTVEIEIASLHETGGMDSIDTTIRKLRFRWSIFSEILE